MALTLLQYAEHLDERGEPCPAGPDPMPCAAKPHAPPLGARAVVLAGWGTAWRAEVPEPELVPSDPVMRGIAFDKTVAEFRMWGSMSRKPGPPGEQLAALVADVRERLLARALGKAGGELPHAAVWRGVLDRLRQKDYAYDEGFYGDPDQYAEKIALYCARAACGMAAYPGAGPALRLLAERGVRVGLHANGAPATAALVARALARQEAGAGFAGALALWSHALGARIESERGWQALEQAVAAAGLRPEHVVYLGNDAERDIAPARRRGFRTALLAADRQHAKVRPEQLKDERTRPHALLTDFAQLPRLCA